MEDQAGANRGASRFRIGCYTVTPVLQEVVLTCWIAWRVCQLSLVRERGSSIGVFVVLLALASSSDSYSKPRDMAIEGTDSHTLRVDE